MRIEAIAHSLPAQTVANDDIVARLRAANGHMSRMQLDELESRTREYLRTAGSQTRQWTLEPERAIDLLRTAGAAALSRAGVAAVEVDLVLYVGVARGWLEPASANLVQAELGASAATGFDILDGCLGWLRGLEVVRALFRTGAYRSALIVSCECGLQSFGRWRFDRPEEVEPYLATYTIGEAATATLVTSSGADDFHFRFRNYGQHTALCLIPGAQVKQFAPGDLPASLMEGKFYARSGELLRHSIDGIGELFHSDEQLRTGVPELLVGHAASEHASHVARARIGLPASIYVSTHARYGNTVASAIPLGLSLAADDGRLRRGTKVLAVGGASGISVGIASFTF